MTIREQLNSIAEKRIIILDGAMGSVVQILNLDEKSYRGELFAEHPIPLEGCNDILCLTRPGAIGAIHDTYLEAGADIIETCSFNSTSISLADYQLEQYSYEINAAAAKIARNSADKFSAHGKPRFVAGSIGPTAKGASLYPDINNPGKRSIEWDELETAYYDCARGLLDGGVDIFLVETVFDTLNAKAALFAISKLLEERQVDVPIIISAAVSGEGGRLLSGQNLEAFMISVLHVKPWAIGLNCSFNAQKLMPHVRTLSEMAPCLVSAYPNAGIPNKYKRYDETPEIMAAHIEPFLKEGLINIVGGCCGSSPAHIAAIADKAQKCPPRTIINQQAKNYRSFYSGLEPLWIHNNKINFNNAGESKDKDEFLKALACGEYEDAADIARDIIENGSSILNIAINENNIKILSSFLDFALMNPYIAKVPFYINSPELSIITAGLKRIQGKGFAGPVNLKDGEDEFIKKIKIIHHFGAAAVITPVDEQGCIKTDEQKMEIAGRIYQILINNNIPAEKIVFDQFITEENPLCLWIQDNCPGVFIAL